MTAAALPTPKVYHVHVAGHAPVQYVALTRGKAIAEAFYDYTTAYDVDFKHFLKVARAYRIEPRPPIGWPILVSGRPAVHCGFSGQYVRFMREGDKRPLLSHPADVEDARKENEK